MFSLLCRLILIHFKDGVGTDEVIYLALGRNLWHGLGLRLLDQPMTMCPPLLPLVSGIFSLFTEDLELGTNFVYVAFGGATVVPYFLLARRLYGPAVGRRASFLLALYPGLLLSFYWGSMTEPLYIFLLVTALLFFYRGRELGRAADFCLAGAFLGLVYLCRSEGILFFPVLLGYAVLAALRTGARNRATLRNLGLLTLCFVLVSAPYPLFLKRHSDSLSISGKTKLVLLAGAMPLQERERLMGRLDETGTSFVDYESLVKDKTVTGMILENPMVLLGGSVLQIRNFLATLFSWKVFPAFLVPFALIGLAHGPWDRRRRLQEGFLAACCLPFLVFLTFRIWPRYLLPLTPVLILWTARGVVLLEDRIRTATLHLGRRQSKVRHWGRALPAAAALLPLLAILAAKPVKARRLVQYPVEYRLAGEWMKANLPPGALILARKPEIAYYAGRLMHPLPNEELPRVLRYARAKRIHTLVVDEYFIATRPQLRFLLKEDAFPEEIELLFEARAPNERKIRVFHLKDRPAPGWKPANAAGESAGVQEPDTPEAAGLPAPATNPSPMP